MLIPTAIVYGSNFSIQPCSTYDGKICAYVGVSTRRGRVETCTEDVDSIDEAILLGKLEVARIIAQYEG